MSKLIQPEHYHALLDMNKTEQGIKLIKDFFQHESGVRRSQKYGGVADR